MVRAAWDVPQTDLVALAVLAGLFWSDSMENRPNAYNAMFALYEPKHRTNNYVAMLGLGNGYLVWGVKCYDNGMAIIRDIFYLVIFIFTSSKYNL